MLEEIATVAKRLAEIGIDDTVFVGGATVQILLSDPAAPPARSTLDVDIVLPVASRTAFSEAEARLRAAGFSQPSDAPICRWVVDGVTVDLMPPFEAILGFSNRWYPGLIEHAIDVELPDGTIVRIGDAPHLLASKLEAFHGRGGDDYRFSRDITDVVTLVDGRAELALELERSPVDVRAYVAHELGRFIVDPDFVDALAGHLPSDDASQRRAPLVLQRMETIAALAKES